jgi:hypothetical protein
MNQPALSGFLLILGFVLVIAGSAVSPPRLYQETDSQVRLEIVESHMGRWTASNVLFELAGLVTVVGLILFSYHVRDDVNSILNWLALLAYYLGPWPGSFFSSSGRGQALPRFPIKRPIIYPSPLPPPLP